MNFNLLPKKPMYNIGMELTVTGSDTLEYIGLKKTDEFFSKLTEIPGVELGVKLFNGSNYVPFFGRIYRVECSIAPPIGTGESFKTIISERALEKSLKNNL